MVELLQCLLVVAVCVGPRVLVTGRATLTLDAKLALSSTPSTQLPAAGAVHVATAGCSLICRLYLSSTLRRGKGSGGELSYTC